MSGLYVRVGRQKSEFYFRLNCSESSIKCNFVFGRIFVNSNEKVN